MVLSHHSRVCVFENFTHMDIFPVSYMGSILNRLLTGISMNKTFSRLGALSLLAAGSSAFAEVPAEVTTAIAAMKTDALVVAGAVLVAIIAVAAIKFIRKGL